MGVFNYYGLAIIILIMIPNVIFFRKNKNFETKFHNRFVEKAEQVGRYGCFLLTIVNIPHTYFGFFFSGGLATYLVVNAILVLSYLIIWCVCWSRYFKFSTYALSIIPSVMFIFSSVMLLYVPLMVLSVIFAVTHITISVKNA